MGDTYSLNIQHIGNSIETSTLKVIREFMLEALQIVDVGEEYPKILIKLFPTDR